jgi:predicted RNA-binding Zn-ribbon protein involved in translation (DUF1610 family)
MQFVPIYSYDNYVSAHIAMGRLEEDGINCWLKDENTVTIDPILTNAVGGIKLMVASSQAERAAGILRTLANQHKALFPCPKCGSLDIDQVSSARKASNWASVIIGFFFTSYAMPVETVFHCFNCAHEYPIKEDTDRAAIKNN